MLEPFPTTSWSTILEARRSSAPGSADALNRLCESYWYPLYAYARRCGSDPDDAMDLTQGYFARLIESGDLLTVDPALGRFRSFLLVSMRHFMAHVRERAGALKRGGAATIVSLDARSAEDRYSFEPVELLTPDRIFERAWATTVVNRVIEYLEREYRASGKAVWFDALKGCLSGQAITYPEAAAELGTSEGALRVAAYRMRKRFGVLLREETAATVADPAEVDDELRFLLAGLSG